MKIVSVSLLSVLLEKVESVVWKSRKCCMKVLYEKVESAAWKCCMKEKKRKKKYKVLYENISSKTQSNDKIINVV
jgi:hypothetical protein